MSRIIKSTREFFADADPTEGRAEAGKGYKFWQWAKNRGQAPVSFGLGAFDLYGELKFYSTQNDVASRIDKTNECEVSAANRKLSINGKRIEVPQFFKTLELKKGKDADDLPSVKFKNRVYKLRPVKNGGKTVVDSDGNRLYEIVELKYEVPDVEEGKAVKVYGIWLDRNNELSKNNVPGQPQTYNFSGKISAFSYIDRNIETGEKNLFTTLLVTWPLGITAAIIKYIGYYGSDLIFNKIPQIIDRVILPVVCGAVLCPIYILGMLAMFLFLDLPQGIIKVFDPSFEVKEIYEKFSSPFKKALEFNQAVIKEGVSGYIKKNVLEAASIELTVKAIKEGAMPGLDAKERAIIINKYRLLKAINAFSSGLNIANLTVSNSSNIMASSLKGVANSVLYVTHGGDSAYLDAAKFLFTEPIKIMQEELGQEFNKHKSAFSDASQKEEELNASSGEAPSQGPSGKGREQNRDQNFTAELKSSGQDLSTSGVRNLSTQSPVISYNTSSSATAVYGRNGEITRSPSRV